MNKEEIKEKHDALFTEVLELRKQYADIVAIFHPGDMITDKKDVAQIFEIIPSRYGCQNPMYLIKKIKKDGHYFAYPNKLDYYDARDNWVRVEK